MSWQAYVDTNLVGTGKVTKAAILGLANQGGVWAASPGFTLTKAEQEAVRGAYATPDTMQATRENGVTLVGTKYFTLQVDERSIYAKRGLDGCVVVKTKQAILVTVYNPPIQQTECIPIVEALADYLISLGY